MELTLDMVSELSLDSAIRDYGHLVWEGREKHQNEFDFYMDKIYVSALHSKNHKHMRSLHEFERHNSVFDLFSPKLNHTRKTAVVYFILHCEFR
jgi:hypothetical protein